ncbi:MAG: relaxase [Pseudomonadota bacterium]
MAIHLMKPENAKIKIVELRGFASDNLMDAFVESYAISKTTKCDQHLFSVSINPPAEADIDDEKYQNAVDRIEKELGLTGQPRAIVRHWKRGDDGVLRSHAHAVWCRIDTDQMKAVHLPFTKLRLREVSRALHIEHGFTMPVGLINSKDRDPRNFSFEQWQQCKRAGKKFREVQSDFRDVWAISDSPAAFTHALAERGYFLAKGNRGHVGVDHKGEKYPVSRYVGIKAKEVRARLGEADNLPSIEDAQMRAAKQVSERLKQLRTEQRADIVVGRAHQKAQEKRQRNRQAREEARLWERQQRREGIEEKMRQSRLRKGLPGLWDWLTGKRRKTTVLNQQEALHARQRNRDEIRDHRNRHLQAMKRLNEEARAGRQKHFDAIKELRGDMERLKQPVEPEAPKPKKRRPTSERPRRRTRTRAGPTLEP